MHEYIPGVGASASRLSRFFAIGAVRRLRGVFCLCSALFKTPWSLESRLVSLEASYTF